MKNEITLYKRKNSVIRFLGLLLVGICFFTIIIFTIDCLYNNKKIELDALIFPIVLIMIGICINKFTGYTKEMLVSYNQKGFSTKYSDFIEWKQLKSWTLKTKKKYDNNPSSYDISHQLNENLPFPLNLFTNIYPTVRKHTLKLELADKRNILFSGDEVNDMFKFLKFLRKNFRNKQKGNFKIW